MNGKQTFYHYKNHYSITTSAHLVGGPGGPDPCPFLIQFKLCPQILKPIRRNTLKNQFKKQKNPSKRCTNSILLKFFNATLTSVRQKNAELIFEKLHLICKLKFHILTPWQLFSIFHSTCYPILGSFTIFNSTFFENLKTILLLNLLI